MDSKSINNVPQVTENRPPDSPRKINPWFIFMIILLLFVAGAGTYYLGNQETSKGTVPVSVKGKTPTSIFSTGPASTSKFAGGVNQISTQDIIPFDSTEMKLRLLLPKDWYVTKTNKVGGSTNSYEVCFSLSSTRSSCQEGMSQVDPVTINVAYYGADPKVSLNDEAVDRINMPYSGLNRETQLMVIDGHEAVLLTSRDGRSKDLLSRDGNKSYGFSISTYDIESAAKYFPVFDQIIKTVKLGVQTQTDGTSN